MLNGVFPSFEWLKHAYVFFQNDLQYRESVFYSITTNGRLSYQVY